MQNHKYIGSVSGCTLLFVLILKECEITIVSKSERERAIALEYRV